MKCYNFTVKVELAQFPVIAFIRLAQGLVDAIWLDLGALNQGYVKGALDKYKYLSFNYTSNKIPFKRECGG